MHLYTLCRICPECSIIARNVVKHHQISGQNYIPGIGHNPVKILPGLQHSVFFVFDRNVVLLSGQPYSTILASNFVGTPKSSFYSLQNLQRKLLGLLENDQVQKTMFSPWYAPHNLHLLCRSTSYTWKAFKNIATRG
jgi:hypothetical protein